MPALLFSKKVSGKENPIVRKQVYLNAFFKKIQPFIFLCRKAVILQKGCPKRLYKQKGRFFLLINPYFFHIEMIAHRYILVTGVRKNNRLIQYKGI
jgi:hypothetical protein